MKLIIIKNGKARENMNVKLKFYNGIKYNPQSDIIKEVECNIKNYKVVTGKKATKLGKQINENSRDKYNEYLIITSDTGERFTFCNSLVDMFII